MKSFTDEASEAIVGYQAVRDAGRDWETYSSNLQGDRDVRDYRQLPLEVDPPDHTDYRHALQPLFLRPRLEQLRPGFQKLAADLMDKCLASESPIDVYREIALPYVVGCLTQIYNRPQDLNEWISWGPDVWTAESIERSGDTLHGYLSRVFSEEPREDVWGFIRQTRPKGVLLNEAEFKGYASVLLAGGRDTVIKLITGLIWHLLQTPEDLAALRQDSTLDRQLINELLRFLSPLPAIERIKTATFDPEKPVYQRLHFASANFDGEVWDEPEKVNIHRGRQPNLAFGYGPHACIGMNLAEFEAKAFLSEFLKISKRFELRDFELKWDEISGIRFVADLTNVSINLVAEAGHDPATSRL